MAAHRSRTRVGTVLAAFVLGAVLLLLPVRADAVQVGTTELVDLTASEPLQPVGDPIGASLSGDGSTLAFYARSVDGVTSCAQSICYWLWRRDLGTGDTGRLVPAFAWSPHSTFDGNDPGDVMRTDLSSDGRYLAFGSCLEPPGSDGPADDNCEIYVYDAATGGYEWASQPNFEEGTNFRGSYLPSISDDGNRVLFKSDNPYCAFHYPADHLCEYLEFGEGWYDDDVFARNRAAGTTKLVSFADDGCHFCEGWGALATQRMELSISGVGGRAAFAGDGTVWVRNLKTATLWNVSTELGVHAASHPIMSGDSARVLYRTGDTAYTGGVGDLVVVRIATGAVDLLDTHLDGRSTPIGLSDDGSVVLFAFEPRDDAAVAGIYSFDRSTRTLRLESATDDGVEADADAVGWTGSDLLTGDGGLALFGSAATNLVPGDADGDWDLFLRHRTGQDVGLPSSPTAVEAAPGDRSVTVSWSPPTDDGGVAILSYRVEVVGVPHLGTVVDGDQSTATVGDLLNGVPYSFTVTAETIAGSGTPSAVIGPVVPRTVPTAPAGVTVFPMHAAVLASWEPPADDGGDAVSGYEVEVVPAGGAGGGSAVTVVPADRTAAVVGGLANGTPVAVSVRAVNAAGAGADAGPVEVTPHACADPLLFSDVDGAHQFCAEIEWLVWRGVTEGFGDGTFRPTAGLSRQALAAFLYRWSASPDGEDPGCVSAPFPDVGFSHVFCGEIAWAADDGVLGGYADGGFHPGAGVSRQALVAALYRLAGAPDGADPACGSAPFFDVPVAHPFCGEVAWAVSSGITTGYADGGFHPASPVSRQAFAAMLARAEAHAHGLLP